MGHTQSESRRSIVGSDCSPDGATGKEDTMARDNEWDEWVRDYYGGDDDDDAEAFTD